MSSNRKRSNKKHMSWAERIKKKSNKVAPAPKKREVDDGSNIKLVYDYVLWANNPTTNDWRAKDKKVVKITNGSEFWSFMNNFSKMGPRFMRYSLMRKGVEPRFEHHENRNGGILSIRTDNKNGCRLWEKLCSYMVINKLLKEGTDDTINGIGVIPRKDCLYIKIWNKNGALELNNTLNDDMLSELSGLSMVYKRIVPDF